MRSYVNQSTFIMYIHVRLYDLDAEVAVILDQSQDKETLRRAWVQQFASHSNTFFHEIYHYWQGLQLPFLYRYAFLSYRVIIQAYAGMARQGQELHDWDCMIPELYRISLPVRIWSLGGTCFVIGTNRTTPPDSATHQWEVSPQDLLETAASISEFQVTQKDHAARTDPRVFRRWCKRFPAYSDGFEIARVMLGEELALVCTVPLINGAFQTSDPCRAFIELLGITKAGLETGQLDRFLSYPEPRQWPNVVQIMLEQLQYESDTKDALILGSPYHRVSLDNWLYGKLNGKDAVHPFLTAKARDWDERAKEQPGYRYLLAQPAWVDESAFSGALTSLLPPLSFVKLYREDAAPIVITTGDTDLPQWSLERLLTIYSVVHQASEVGVDPANRLCHHSTCPEYLPNYCNSFPAIPRDFRSCRFPTLQAELSEHWAKDQGGLDVME